MREHVLLEGLPTVPYRNVQPKTSRGRSLPRPTIAPREQLHIHNGVVKHTGKLLQWKAPREERASNYLSIYLTVNLQRASTQHLTEKNGRIQAWQTLTTCYPQWPLSHTTGTW